MYKYVYIGSLYDYNEFYENQISELLYNVYSCKRLEKRLHGLSSLFFKIHNSKKVNRIFHLPYKNVWVDKVLDKEVCRHLEHDDKICFIYSGSPMYLEMGLISYLKKKYTNSKFAFYFTDRVDYFLYNYPSFFSRYISEFDLIITYNKIDSDKFGFILAPPYVVDYTTVEEDSTIPATDVFFIGKEKGRLNELLQVFEICKSFGLKLDFYIFGVPKKQQKYSNLIHYNRYMTYKEVLCRVKRTKCVLNLIQNDAVGITLRDIEAIGMNKLLMTNNPAILDSDFYTAEKIIWVENLHEDIKKLFLVKDSTTWNGKLEYSIQNFFSWFEKVLTD